MTDHEAFLHGILQHPDDDAPRQVYADWLEERGDPRGEFIRVQCALAQLPADDPRWDALEQREFDLLRAHEAEWTKDIKSLVSDWQFHRGFVDTVSMGARAFLDNAAKLLSRAPIRNVTLLRLGNSGVDVEELAACPQLTRLRGLEWNGQLDDDYVVDFFQAAQLKQLATLGVAGHGFHSHGRPWVDLPSLEELNLKGGRGFHHHQRLFESTCSLRLKKLNLSVAAPFAVDVARLASWPGLASLTHLNLANHQFRVAGAQALAASPHLTNLVSLELEGCAIGLKGTQALANSAALANLTSLNLQNNNVPDAGVQAIITSPHWSQLRELYLGMNSLGAKGTTLLVGWPGLDRLNVLHLWLNKSIGDEGVKLLAESPRVANLFHLDLGYTSLSPRGVLPLVKSPHLQRLRHLNVEGNKIGDAGVITLVKAPVVTSLRVLNLARTEMKDSAAKAIMESPHLQHLRTLKLNGNKLNKSTREALDARFGLGVCQFGQQ